MQILPFTRIKKTPGRGAAKLSTISGKTTVPLPLSREYLKPEGKSNGSRDGNEVNIGKRLLDTPN